MPSRRNPSTTTFFVDSTVGDADPKSMRAARGFPSSGFEGLVNDLNYLSFVTALDCAKYFGPIHTATVPDAGSYANLERRNPLIGHDARPTIVRRIAEPLAQKLFQQGRAADADAVLDWSIERL